MAFRSLVTRALTRQSAPLMPARAPIKQVRFGGGQASHGSGTVIEGFDITPPKKRLVFEAKFWGALGWFWIFYQLEQNWDVMLV
jgi:hypothetical protein